uniref:Uncharacterized protein n=1 Tax=Hyaloperonospora arabidopsidis (strain Emoy2) TaxID=559515 RepID=M4BJT9_HYAAE
MLVHCSISYTDLRTFPITSLMSVLVVAHLIAAAVPMPIIRSACNRFLRREQSETRRQNCHMFFSITTLLLVYVQLLVY